MWGRDSLMISLLMFCVPFIIMFVWLYRKYLYIGRVGLASKFFLYYDPNDSTILYRIFTMMYTLLIGHQLARMRHSFLYIINFRTRQKNTRYERYSYTFCSWSMRVRLTDCHFSTVRSTITVVRVRETLMYTDPFESRVYLFMF